jgi:hypothetical protein
MAGPGFGSIAQAVKDRAVTLRNTLAGAGVPATLEPGQVDPPGAWITMRTMERLTLAGGFSVRFHVYLIAPAVGVLEALDLLAPMLDRALTVFDPDEPVNLATAVTLPHTPGQPLPAFLLVVDEIVEA